MFHVQAIVYEDDAVGWSTQSERDFYIWRDNRWWGVDVFGLVQYLHTPGWKRVLLGELISTSQYHNIIEQALKDRDFGKKNGYLPINRERRPIE